MKNQTIETIDKQYVWHPFTQMKEWQEESQLVITGGEGVRLCDENGNWYYDGNSSMWVNLHGHRKKELDDAIIHQLTSIAHSTFLGLSSPPAALLAKELISIVPEGLSRVFYSDSGSEAVEIALKMAFQYWQQREKPVPTKTMFLHLVNSYHGDTIGSVSVGGIDLFHSTYHPLLFPTISVPCPYCYRCPFECEPNSCKMECLESLTNVIKKEHERIAAFIIEPLAMGAAGMITFPDRYLTKVRELCNTYNILLIADEVATGFGRTGKMFACDHEEISPDIMTVAKGLTGGYLPLAATITTEEIFNAFLGDASESKTFFHGHSYTGNQLACAVARANLELFQKDQIIPALCEKVTLIESELKWFYTLSHVGDIRQIGMMVGIELVKNPDSRQPYLPEDGVIKSVILEAQQRGMITRPLGNVIVFLPPLSSTLKELHEMLNILFESITSVTRD
ncbi:adenosylmethionine--8-amino-7-oxononanoate transaminase [Methanospirillum lacunae]|uniref:Adenosylmethionine-8-amino-7-oxononanoate aminotransferase n=1 Tax=Methanospirillum lacunae TaxID=668570 RepID=A0A2V2N2Z9_9EURY|nr:adenosylmethionine--8-amino-7-oxononanoate transaminase [Methanospirillum lacunae]PWR74522.1 adenosylmethionine--8-amino-7-oxononanoate transaminase [Methanospirillum lacunae]